MKNPNIRKKHIIYFLILCFFLLLFKLLNITCPILFLFGVPCPTCGVTRALFSLLELNFTAYCKFNVMAIPLLFATCVFIHLKVLKKKKLPLAVATVVLIINFTYYFIRLLAH